MRFKPFKSFNRFADGRPKTGDRAGPRSSVIKFGYLTAETLRAQRKEFLIKKFFELCVLRVSVVKIFSVGCGVVSGKDLGQGPAIQARGRFQPKVFQDRRRDIHDMSL